MDRNSKATVNSIFSDYAGLYMKKGCTTDYEKKIIRAISICRTEELGGRKEYCSHCGYVQTLYNSCRNRHCPLCQFMKKEKWILDKKSEVLPYQYFHVVFTIPKELNRIMYHNRRVMYKYFFDTVKQTLFEILCDKKYLGAETGFFGILHTWGQKLNLHPHIHCVIPGGGYRKDKNKWIHASKNFLVSKDVLGPKFMYNFLTGLKKLYNDKEIKVEENSEYFQKQIIDKLFNVKWVVYLKESFKNSDSVIEYLSRYTHRIAISNYRIKKVENDKVHFEYRDYKRDNKKFILVMPVLKFMRFFCMHIVPYRFVRIRYYGILSHRNKANRIKECYNFYELKMKHEKIKLSWGEVYSLATGNDVTICRECKKGRMILYEYIVPKNRGSTKII